MNDEILKEIQQLIERNPSILVVPDRKMNEGRDLDVIDFLLSIQNIPSIQNSIQIKALQLFSRQFTWLFQTEPLDSSEYFKSIIDQMEASSQYSVLKRLRKTLAEVVSFRNSFHYFPAFYLLQKLSAQHIGGGIFHVVLGLSEGFDKLSMDGKSDGWSIFYDLLSCIIKVYYNNQELSILYWLMKLFFKVYSMSQSKLASKFKLSLTYLPLIFRTAFATHPQYDSDQSVVCEQKNSQEFYYSHAKKWAFKIVDQIFQLVKTKNNDETSEIYEDFSSDQDESQQDREEENNYQSCIQSLKQTLITTYIQQITFFKLVKVPPTTLYIHLQCLSHIAFKQFHLIKQYSDFLKWKFLPQFIKPTAEDNKLNCCLSELKGQYNNEREQNKLMGISRKLMVMILKAEINSEQWSLKFESHYQFLIELLGSTREEDVFIGLIILKDSITKVYPPQTHYKAAFKTILQNYLFKLLNSTNMVNVNLCLSIIWSLKNQLTKDFLKTNHMKLLKISYQKICSLQKYVRFQACLSFAYLIRSDPTNTIEFKIDNKVLLQSLLEVLDSFYLFERTNIIWDIFGRLELSNQNKLNILTRLSQLFQRLIYTSNQFKYLSELQRIISSLFKAMNPLLKQKTTKLNVQTEFILVQVMKNSFGNLAKLKEIAVFRALLLERVSSISPIFDLCYKFYIVASMEKTKIHEQYLKTQYCSGSQLNQYRSALQIDGSNQQNLLFIAIYIDKISQICTSQRQYNQKVIDPMIYLWQQYLLRDLCVDQYSRDIINRYISLIILKTVIEKCHPSLIMPQIPLIYNIIRYNIRQRVHRTCKSELFSFMINMVQIICLYFEKLSQVNYNSEIDMVHYVVTNTSKNMLNITLRLTLRVAKFISNLINRGIYHVKSDTPDQSINIFKLTLKIFDKVASLIKQRAISSQQQQSQDQSQDENSNSKNEGPEVKYYFSQDILMFQMFDWKNKQEDDNNDMSVGQIKKSSEFKELIRLIECFKGVEPNQYVLALDSFSQRRIKRIKNQIKIKLR